MPLTVCTSCLLSVARPNLWPPHCHTTTTPSTCMPSMACMSCCSPSPVLHRPLSVACPMLPTLHCLPYAARPTLRRWPSHVTQRRCPRPALRYTLPPALRYAAALCYAAGRPTSHDDALDLHTIDGVHVMPDAAPPYARHWPPHVT
ncbi:hypothetical protein B0H14DRAFT_3526843 [Mycena olivaceomarginata]|nr:hypothetical protein B0H14DRAFT_3526843 [Mycena olivaceomarginata]